MAALKWKLRCVIIPHQRCISFREEGAKGHGEALLTFSHYNKQDCNIMPQPMVMPYCVRATKTIVNIVVTGIKPFS